ncbi:hypothetical protein CEXT_620281 [Caerostris extrusa]|uniref:Uncharacterized protein n=1 Tax=Caerostris extrusa TaxID=172846 RepID=A0AAV4WXN7_CAEEX|nr:hypothetical protein CEXT_620281 [Caerostris extrusa]
MVVEGKRIQKNRRKWYERKTDWGGRRIKVSSRVMRESALTLEAIFGLALGVSGVISSETYGDASRWNERGRGSEKNKSGEQVVGGGRGGQRTKAAGNWFLLQTTWCDRLTWENKGNERDGSEENGIREQVRGGGGGRQRTKQQKIGSYFETTWCGRLNCERKGKKDLKIDRRKWDERKTDWGGRRIKVSSKMIRESALIQWEVRSGVLWVSEAEIFPRCMRCHDVREEMSC